MGIGGNIMEGLIWEARYKPFSGTVYTLGRPTMGFTPERVTRAFSEIGCLPIGGEVDRTKIDIITTMSKEVNEGYIDDREFFRMLGFRETKAVDISDFEGAEIIVNLNDDLPPHLERSCDLLVDASTLDNLFDPISALRNSVRMLKDRGRLVISAQGNYSRHFNGIPYLIMTPVWLYDYFCINHFVSFSIYAVAWRGNECHTFVLNTEHALRKWGLGYIKPFMSEYHVQICAFAERGPETTWHRNPNQHVYRSAAEWEEFEAVVKRQIDFDRIPHVRSTIDETDMRPTSEWFFVAPDWTVRNLEQNLIARQPPIMAQSV